MLTTTAATRKNWGIAEDVDEPYKEEVKKIFREPGFTESLQPITGAVTALKQMVAEGHDVRLCTSPLVNQPMGVGEKFVWLAAVLGDEWKKRIIITSDKTLVKGQVLIDDKLDIVDEKSACNPPEWKQCATTHAHHLVVCPACTLLRCSPDSIAPRYAVANDYAIAGSSFVGPTWITRTLLLARRSSIVGRSGRRSSLHCQARSGQHRRRRSSYMNVRQRNGRKAYKRPR